jgi:hypothetical protein
VLGLDSGCRHEELAVRALEAAITLHAARDQVGSEGLLAVRAPNLFGRRLLRHPVPGYLRMVS